MGSGGQRRPESYLQDLRPLMSRLDGGLPAVSWKALRRGVVESGGWGVEEAEKGT